MEQIKLFVVESIQALTDPSPGKTVAIGGIGVTFRWAVVRSVAADMVVIASAVLLLVHLVIAVTKFYCPARRKRITPSSPAAHRYCSRCPLCERWLCPFGMGTDEDRV